MWYVVCTGMEEVPPTGFPLKAFDCSGGKCLGVALGSIRYYHSTTLFQLCSGFNWSREGFPVSAGFVIGTVPLLRLFVC